MKKVIFGLVLTGVILILGAFAYAQDHSDHHQMMQMPMNEQKQEVTVTSKKAINVGNLICPVMGEKIDEKTKETYEYKGKIYNLCCSTCVEEFKKNPEKYVQIVDKEKKNNEPEAKNNK